MEGFLIAFVIVAVAMVFLVARDNWRRFRKDERRSVEDRIAAIAAQAACTRNQLQDLPNRLTRLPVEADRLGEIINYYLRLEELATAKGVSFNEVDLFAKESMEFVRRKQLKGIDVPFQAKKLAKLIQRRQSRSTTSN